MKRGTVIGFILGAAVGAGAMYVVKDAEVQKAVEDGKRKVAEAMQQVGKTVEKAGRNMTTPEKSKK